MTGDDPHHDVPPTAPSDVGRGPGADVPGPDATPADPAIDRRAFVRRMTGDATHLAGRLHGVSRMFAVGAAAAGKSVADGLEGMAAASEPPEPTDPAPAGSPGPPSDPAPPDLPPPAAAAAALSADEPAPSKRATPTWEQAALLEGSREVHVAVNDAGRAPQLTITVAHWDGETIRFAGLGWSRRARALDADPHVTLVVASIDDDRYLTITGQAVVVRGAAVEAAMRPLLEADGVDGDPDERWRALVAEDPDRIVVLVTPESIMTARR